MNILPQHSDPSTQHAGGSVWSGEKISLATIYEAAQAHLITFDAVTRKQQDLYPRCIAHDTPTAFLIDGMALCIECVMTHHAYIIARLRGE